MQKEVLKRPLMTEKLMNKGEYAFEVDLKSTKPEIAQTIKKVFGVDPIAIRTIIVKGRSRKSFKTRKSVKVSPWKKAILRLKKDQKIDLFESSTEAKK